jgi:hypothetical protein
MADKQRLSMDDILKEIEDVAKHGDGADKFRALKFLASAETAQSFLPPPLEPREVVDRLVRVMRPAGPDMCRVAFKEAFHNTRSLIAKLGIDGTAMINEYHLTEEDKQTIQSITSLKQFYKTFQELKRPGFPTGYPSGRDKITQQAWLQAQAQAILMDRAQKRQDAPSLERPDDPQTDPVGEEAQEPVLAD